jgi:hypothetical protein
MNNETRLEAFDRAEQEAARSANGPTFTNVSPAELFGPKSSTELALRVFRQNPTRYRALRQEWAYLSGAEAPPDNYYS